MSKKGICYLESRISLAFLLVFSCVFFINKCSLLHQNNSDHSEGAWWIGYDLVHLNIFSSSWHFCVCFSRAQTFCCISTASFAVLCYNHIITSMLHPKLCNLNTFWNMNDVFTVSFTVSQIIWIILVMFRAQGSQDEPEIKEIIHNFGKKAFTSEQMSKSCYFEYVKW